MMKNKTNDTNFNESEDNVSYNVGVKFGNFPIDSLYDPHVLASKSTDEIIDAMFRRVEEKNREY